MDATITPQVRAKVGGWPRHVVGLGVVVVGLLALFARDAGDMAAIWWTSSTYEHCLVILPIVGWLVWQRAPVLAEVRPKAWALPLLWVAAGAFGWLLGEAAGVAVVRHLALVMMIQGATAVMLGRGALAALLFPLSYALFLVPAGDMLVPPLQTLTARICMVLLGVVQVPAHLDGVFITTPGGWFKVAEACSGAKFLIAMTALGVLVANLGFRSWRRRAMFMLLAVIAPVLANGIRAFGTIWVAQYKGAAVAGSFDHIVYGWIFFA
ncbi:MAG: exosortase A, partial [Sphingomonas oligoaromativorans]